MSLANLQVIARRLAEINYERGQAPTFADALREAAVTIAHRRSTYLSEGIAEARRVYPRLAIQIEADTSQDGTGQSRLLTWSVINRVNNRYERHRLEEKMMVAILQERLSQDRGITPPQTTPA